MTKDWKQEMKGAKSKMGYWARRRQSVITVKNIKLYREKLMEENREYYDKFSKAIVTEGKLRDGFGEVDAFNTVISDILRAQEDGQTARGYFGISPEQLAGDWLAQLKKRKWLFLTTLGIMLVVYPLTILIFKSYNSNLGWTGIVLQIAFFATFMSYFLFGRSFVYQLFPYKSPRERRRIFWSVGVAVLFFFLALSFILYLFVKK